MQNIEKPDKPLRVAVSESRQLNFMSQLLEARGAEVLRVPLVSIYDAPNSQEILSWLKAFVTSPPDLLIIFTGEGVRRLLSLSDKNALKSDFVAALAKTKKLCRGPKPVRELQLLGLTEEFAAKAPTTEGVIATLDKLDISDQRIAVQLYGEEPNQKLMDYLLSRKAKIETVAPYVYANESDEEEVVTLIHNISEGNLDVVVFTAQPQLKRILQVARKHRLEELLKEAWSKVTVAAVGPVVKAQLEAAGVTVDIVPSKMFFMKPLVNEIMKLKAQES